MSVCLPVCLLVCLPACLSVSLSVCLPVCLSVCLSVCPFVCLCVCLFCSLHLCLCLCVSLCGSICFSLSLSLSSSLRPSPVRSFLVCFRVSRRIVPTSLSAGQVAIVYVYGRSFLCTSSWRYHWRRGCARKHEVHLFPHVRGGQPAASEFWRALRLLILVGLGVAVLLPTSLCWRIGSHYVVLVSISLWLAFSLFSSLARDVAFVRSFVVFLSCSLFSLSLSLFRSPSSVCVVFVASLLLAQFRSVPEQLACVSGFLFRCQLCLPGTPGAIVFPFLGVLPTVLVRNVRFLVCGSSCSCSQATLPNQHDHVPKFNRSSVVGFLSFNFFCCCCCCPTQAFPACAACVFAGGWTVHAFYVRVGWGATLRLAVRNRPNVRTQRCRDMNQIHTVQVDACGGPTEGKPVRNCRDEYDA